jgi:hypothetical protein
MRRVTPIFEVEDSKSGDPHFPGQERGSLISETTQCEMAAAK